MHTEESILTEMRRLGFVLTPLAHVGYHFEYCGHDLFLCPDRKQNNVMTMTTASIVDEDTIGYHTVLFSSATNR